MKINKIHNAGILELDSEIELQKYSLFYGYNGSGKTTLSRLLDLLGLPECDRKKNITDDVRKGQEEIIFKINGKNYDDVTNEFINNIKVFNRDFIEREVFAPKGMAKVILGKPNADLHKKLKEMEDLKNSIAKLNDGFDKSKKIPVNDTQYVGVENLNRAKGTIENNIDTLFIDYAEV